MEGLQVSDYERMSDTVVNDFLKEDVNLNDGILKVAQERDLNPEQVKRLVEMSNTKTFLKKFSEKDDGDKNVNFDVADSNKILKAFYSDDAPKSIKITKVTISRVPGNDLELDFPDMMRSIRENIPEPVKEEKEEKAASEKIDTTEEVKITKKAKYKTTLRLRKIAEELLNRVYESEYSYNDERDKLASEFCKLYGPDYREFEKDAILHYGTEDIYAKYALEDIRKCIRWDKPMYSASKNELLQKVAGFETPELETFKKMCELKKVQQKYAEGLKVVNQKLEKLFNE